MEFYFSYLLILQKDTEDLVKPGVDPGVGVAHVHEHALPVPVVAHAGALGQVPITHQVYGLDAIVATFYSCIFIKH